MGGDRDGNPRVTSEVTRDVCLLARMMAANLYFSQIEDLMFELSMWRCINELRVVLNIIGPQKRCKTLYRDFDIPEELAFTHVEQFLEPLELCYRSLCDCGDRPIADGSLLDFLRQVSTFGLSLVRLDIGKNLNGTLMSLMLLQSTWALGLTENGQRKKDREWLLSELRGKRPLIGPDLPKPKKLLRCWTLYSHFRTSSDSFGAYIISMATSPSVYLL
ncbi:hypothetical protein LWI28_026356 [Acer negundo]|uniref:Phosphoenolpyruvate carboxylase n=1 Tax=Acer negundo TaxID=4023 RepID=A0AAD5IXW3_ACENE|nr:hypothetical protein LWI28_026356 [Acer negundo]